VFRLYLRADDELEGGTAEGETGSHRRGHVVCHVASRTSSPTSKMSLNRPLSKESRVRLPAGEIIVLRLFLCLSECRKLRNRPGGSGDGLATSRLLQQILSGFLLAPTNTDHSYL
jgi:hypothetical protein